ncbi:MAG: class I SAM-dependent methyltransferase [Candidatus Puniceispirillaceae bacterium]|jgi:MPBQ/MSBQ methyltransferase
MTSPDAVETYYRGQGLAGRIFTALAREGHDIDRLTPAILAPYDEFHVGGMEATQRVAGRLDLSSSSRLLDIGCGAGGPARAIAAAHGCHVTGVDLTADFITAGDRLSGACGLQALVTLHHASALDLPFGNESFDCAMMLHVGMNITDKHTLMAEAARVLASNGLFCVYDMMRVGDGGITFPLPWASDASVSAVETPETYTAAAKDAGLELLARHDGTAAARPFIDHVIATKPAPVPGQPPDRFRNLAGHMEAGILAPTELVFRKAG